MPTVHPLTGRVALVAGATRGAVARRTRAPARFRDLRVTDTDGSRPDCWGYIAAHGIGEQSGAGVEEFR